MVPEELRLQDLYETVDTPKENDVCLNSIDPRTICNGTYVC